MITINGNASTPQPISTGVLEQYIQIQKDTESINGSQQRDRKGQKKQATLQWDALAPADYQLLIGYFYSGSTVTYNNNQSAASGGTFSFTGLPTVQEGKYFAGTTLLKPLTVVIREA